VDLPLLRIQREKERERERDLDRWYKGNWRYLSRAISLLLPSKFEWTFNLHVLRTARLHLRASLERNNFTRQCHLEIGTSDNSRYIPRCRGQDTLSKDNLREIVRNQSTRNELGRECERGLETCRGAIHMRTRFKDATSDTITVDDPPRADYIHLWKIAIVKDRRDN